METKDHRYESICQIVETIVEAETDSIAVMANTAAEIMQTFNFLWTGFYRVHRNFLVLGPFQGPPACMRIQRGKGVCGTAWAKKECIIVPDVDKFPGHIVCNSRSRSEIVVPILKNGRVTAVLDIDSENLNTFDFVDKLYLSRIASMLESK